VAACIGSLLVYVCCTVRQLTDLTNVSYKHVTCCKRRQTVGQSPNYTNDVIIDRTMIAQLILS